MNECTSRDAHLDSRCVSLIIALTVFILFVIGGTSVSPSISIAMSKRVLCKFFAHGACLKGEHCEFSHDWKDAPNNVCTFYLKGVCAFGSRCRYEHVKPLRSESPGSSSSTSSRQSLVSDSSPLGHHSQNLSGGVSLIPGVLTELSALSRPFFPSKEPAWKVESEQLDFVDAGNIGGPRTSGPADRPICSFAAAGNCPRGENCPHIHGNLCPICGKQCLHPFRPEEREEHLRTCEKKQKNLEALKHSQEIECSVCLERVLSKPTAAERKFGLLSECDHPFCISCIRNWRSSSPTSGMDVNSALRACPICRKLSYFVIPSVIWYTTKEEKQEIVDSYKAKLRSIDCKHFDFGNGSCPFGTSCFYKHTVKPGSYVWKYQRPPPRRPTQRRSNALDMDTLFDMVADLEEMMFDSPEDLDIFCLDPVEIAYVLRQLAVSSDSSSDEEINI